MISVEGPVYRIALMTVTVASPMNSGPCCTLEAQPPPPHVRYAGFMEQTMEPPVAAGSKTQLEEVFKSIIEHAGAKTVYGEPVSVDGKTVLPVATIRYGFGVGSGAKADGEHGIDLLSGALVGADCGTLPDAFRRAVPIGLGATPCARRATRTASRKARPSTM